MKKMTKKKIENLAVEIRSLLLENELWTDVTIYFNGKAFSTDDRKGHFFYNDNNNLVVLENIDPKDYFEYVGDILSMSFEGDFYDVLNYGYLPSVLDKFDKLLEKYGLYYELGNAWNLSVYPA